MRKTVHLFILFLFVVKAYPFDGEGTRTSPYQIKNASDLIELSVSINEKGQSYKDCFFQLTDNIDLSSVANWIPIGNKYQNAFQGIFDGNGFRIDNIKIETNNDCAGLFGYINNSLIKNLIISGDIKGKSRVGGIVANSIYSVISGCKNESNVFAASSFAGGIAGIAIKTNITNCINKGKFSSAGLSDPIVSVNYDPTEIFLVHENRNGIFRVKPEFEKIPFVYIPAIIDGLYIRRIYDNAFKDNIYVEEVVIADGALTNLHAEVFSGCKNLKEIKFPKNKFAIGNYCFSGCSGLKGTFVIPDAVHVIGGGVFNSCINIEELQISSNLLKIPRSFVGMRNLKKVVLNQHSVPELLDKTAFLGARKDLEFYVPASLVDEYRTAPNWDSFNCFVALP